MLKYLFMLGLLAAVPTFANHNGECKQDCSERCSCAHEAGESCDCACGCHNN